MRNGLPLAAATVAVRRTKNQSPRYDAHADLLIEIDKSAQRRRTRTNSRQPGTQSGDIVPNNQRKGVNGGVWTE
jgi:hypothetical protein